MFIVVVEAADSAYEVAPALVPGPLVNNLTSSLLRLGDTCSTACWIVTLAAGMEISATEEVGRALRDGPADAEAEEEVERQRREAPDFLGAAGGGATGLVMDVGGPASGGGTAGVEDIGAVDVVGTNMVVSADIGIFDEVSSTVSFILEDETLEFVREAHATPGTSSAGSGCCERSTMGWMSGVEGKRGGFVGGRGGERGGVCVGVAF